jgi:hypothetical protein
MQTLNNSINTIWTKMKENQSTLVLLIIIALFFPFCMYMVNNLCANQSMLQQLQIK